MKLLIVCDVLGEENNGTTMAAMNLIRDMRSRGHEVRVLCADQFRKGDEGFYVVPNLSLGKLLDAYVKKVGVSLAKADKTIIRQAMEGVDLVHIMLPFSLGNASVKIANKMDLPVTAGFHMMAEIFSSYVKMSGFEPLNRFIYHFIYKKLYSKVDAVHYPTKFVQDIFEKVVHHKTNGYAISNGVSQYVEKKEISRPKEFEDKIVVMTTGRYASEKKQDVLLKAVNYSKYKDKIQLVLAGQGVKDKYYKKLGAKLPVEPIFKFYNRTELVDMLNVSDIYVHAGEIEIEGIACLEALTCGKFLIASDSKRSAPSGFVLDKKCLFKNRKPKDLARVLDYWIERPEERKELEDKYLEMSKQFNQKLCFDKMEEMFTETIKNHGKK